MENNVPSDEELLQSARRLDRQALARIYDLYSPGLYRYAMRLLGDTSLAEDCVAETFTRFLQALRARKGPRNYLQAYLYRIAHNWISDQYRRSPPHPVQLDPETYSDNTQRPEDMSEQRQRQARVQAAIQSLTTDQQLVITLKFLEGWQNEDIARALEKPIGAIKSLQHRALARLQRILVDED